MARCTSCGSENVADASFCRQCGRALGQDGGPITVVPGQPAEPGTRSRLSGAIIGLMFLGLAAATAIGYFVGAHSNSVVATTAPAAAPPIAAGAPAEPDAQQNTAAAVAAPAAEAPPPKKAHSNPPDKPKPTEAAPPAEDAQWPRMRAELAACGKANLVCHEKVRWRYCKHMWGKVPECPQAEGNASTN